MPSARLHERRPAEQRAAAALCRARRTRDKPGGGRVGPYGSPTGDAASRLARVAGDPLRDGIVHRVLDAGRPPAAPASGSVMAPVVPDGTRAWAWRVAAILAALAFALVGVGG